MVVPDLDDWIGYSTKKTVFIRDRWLGFVYYGLVFAVLIYIFGVQILRNNEQFLLSNVQGIPRLKVSHPTKGHCELSHPGCMSNYRSLRDLSYCREYEGDSPLPHQSSCKYEDAISIMPDGEVDNKLFIPTAVEIFTETKSCKPGPENGYTCDNEYEELPGSDCLLGNFMCETRGGEKEQFYYVADAKNFNIQFTSSYEQGEVHGTSLDHPAYYEICDARVRNASGTHLWTDRLQHSEDSETDCSEGSNTRIVKLPCQKGVFCRQKADFDFLHHTGVDRALKKTDDAVGGSLSRLKNLEEDTVDTIKDIGTGSTQKEEGEDEQTNGDTRIKSTHSLHRFGGLGHLGFLHQQHPHKGNLEISSFEAWEKFGSDTSDLLTKQQRDFIDQQRLQMEKSFAFGGDEDYQQWASAYGDVFTLQRLMELAGADLDKSYNMDGWTTRESGTVLEVSVVYNNLHAFMSSFGYKEVEYHYRVKELPLPYVSRRSLAKVQPPDFPETRRYEIRHGVMIWFRVVGQFGNFKTTYLLIYLVTAFALIAAASSVTDFIAIYVHKRKNNYFNLKYDVSPDFSDMWQCSKCQYWNVKKDKECQRYPMWKNCEDSPRCGAPKPSE